MTRKKYMHKLKCVTFRYSGINSVRENSSPLISFNRLKSLQKSFVTLVLDANV